MKSLALNQFALTKNALKTIKGGDNIQPVSTTTTTVSITDPLRKRDKN
jgi:hypothetical protein